MQTIAAVIIACTALSAVDGDTIKCDGQNMRLLGPGIPFKSGVDAPETRNAQCPKERLLGIQAKLRLEELLNSPRLQIEDSGEKDRYGRPLVWVRLGNGRTAGEILIFEGYARPWRAGKTIDWCN